MKKQSNKIKILSHILHRISPILIILFAFHFSLFTNSVFSQTPILYGPPGSSTMDLYVNYLEPEIVYASNYEGGFFKSADFGSTVKILEVQNKDFQINSIFYSTLNKKTFAFAVDYLVAKSDGVSDWELVFDCTGYGPRIKHFIVNSFDERTMYMSRYGKEIWRSDDAGENWYLLHTFESDIDRIAIASSDSSVLYVVAYGLYKSVDSGKNWYKTFENYNFGNSAWQLKVNPQNPNSVFLQAGGYLYKAIGEVNNVDTTVIYNLADYIIDPKDTLIMYVAASDPNFGTGGGMMKTIDGGKNWFDITNGLPFNGQTVRKLAVDPINTNTVYAGTSGRGVYKTTDGGESWELTNLVNDGYIYNYEVLDSQTGTIIFTSYGWHLIKTTDGGKSWIKPTFLPQENSYKILKYSTTFNPNNKSIGFHGDGTDLFKTTDGGTTWEKTLHVPTCKMVIYHTFNTEIIYAKAEDDMRYLTQDGGITWKALNVGEIPTVFASNDEKIAYYHNQDKIGKTIDMGKTWKTYSEGLPRDYQDGQYWIKPIMSLVINDKSPNILYCGQRALSVTKGALAKSIDGGESWFEVDSTLIELDPMISVQSVCIDQDNPQRIFVGLNGHGQPFTETFSNGALFLTEDDCKTWKKLYNSNVDNIKIDYTTTPKTIYFTTKFGLMSLPDTAHVTEVEKNNNTIPTKFELYQNYPNPFNPSTTIKYFISESANIKLEVFDLLGNKIRTLSTGFQKSGEHSAVFNSENLSSGIYFYRLNSGKQYLAKKMLLLK